MGFFVSFPMMLWILCVQYIIFPIFKLMGKAMYYFYYYLFKGIFYISNILFDYVIVPLLNILFDYVIVPLLNIIKSIFQILLNIIKSIFQILLNIIKSIFQILLNIIKSILPNKIYIYLELKYNKYKNIIIYKSDIIFNRIFEYFNLLYNKYYLFCKNKYFNFIFKNDGDNIKCIGVFKNYHYYYDVRHKQFFLITPTFKATRCPARHNKQVEEWCDRTKGKFLDLLEEQENKK